MMGPERNPEYADCFYEIAEMLPTPFLEFRGGVLHQWYEATSKADRYGTIHTKGEWRPVPSRS